MAEITCEGNGILARYYETETERVLVFEHEGRSATIAQNRYGYAMLMVRVTPTGTELERYYGFDMAIDHAAELLNTDPTRLPIPADARDMGM